MQIFPSKYSRGEKFATIVVQIIIILFMTAGVLAIGIDAHNLNAAGIIALTGLWVTGWAFLTGMWYAALY